MPGKRQPDPYMMTRGGIKVPLYSTPPECFDPVQIAKTLAHLPRYVGNYGAYSVAQHAVNVADVASELGYRVMGDDDLDWVQIHTLELAALHHDDAEAVTGDIPSPVKRELRESFQPIEDSLNHAIEDRYELDRGTLDNHLIKEADLIVFCAEVRMLVPKEAWPAYTQDVGVGVDHNLSLQPSWTSIVPWTANKAFATYMDYHDTAVKGRTL